LAPAPEASYDVAAVASLLPSSFATPSSEANVSDDLATGTRTDSERRGITIGILVVALMCLSLFFVWHHYGVAGSAEHPGAETTR